ncbi:MAG: APC family permease [Thermoplasmatales archaeon]
MVEETRKYRKELGFWHVVFLTIGAILGPAVAFVPVTVLALGGPAGLFSWPVALILIIPIALVYVELGAMWPRAGGVAYYPAKSHGPLVGLLNGWAAFVGYSLAMPAVVAAIVEYGSYYVPQFYSNGKLSILGVAVAIIAIITITLINTRRIRFLGDVNNAFTIIKIALVLVVSFALLFYFHPANLTRYGGFAPLGATGVFLAISATIFAYAGFRQPIDYAEEVHDPGKFLPLAIITSLVVVMAIYLIESFAFLGVINWSKLGLGPNSWGELTTLGYPYASAALVIGVGAVAVIAILGVVIASYSDGIIYYGGAARVANTLARYDRYFPSLFSKMSSKGIPIYSVILVLIISVIYIILLPSFSSILGVFVDAVVFSYAPSAISLSVFRKKFPEENRPYKLPIYSVLAPIAFVVGGLLIYWSGWTAVWISMVSVFAGLVFLIVYHHGFKITSNDIISGIWLPVYMIVVLIISYVGSLGPLSSPILRYPYDTIVFIIIALAFYYVGYFSGMKYTGKGTVDS